MKKCSYCSYESKRQYNLDRHLYTIHCDNLKDIDTNVSINCTNVSPNSTNVSSNSTNVSLSEQPSEDIFKCNGCYKDFLTKQGFARHQTRCKAIYDSLQCKHCHILFIHRSSKSRHEKKCEYRNSDWLIQKTTDSTVSSLPTNTTIHNTTNNIQINNNQHIHINLLTYPPNGEHSREFDFLRDHITSIDIQRIFEKAKPEIGFSRFIYSILERPENRIVHKTHPNNNYSKVHIGDGKWSLELDEDVYTVMTHFLTCAALQSTEEHKQFMRHIEQKIKSYLDDVNTQNDENNNYTKAMQRVRLIIINLTNKWKQEGWMQPS
uniref:Uncharacterized protein n=1 Tax=viral metagenome TaxID=1070528 RepID=A0A6C0CT33_9ZZZZ